MSQLSVSEHDGVLVVDSRLVAERLGIEHESFMKTLREYQSLIEEDFGSIRFEIGSKTGANAKAGGKQPVFCLLTEDQATVLMTFSRNTSQVVKCKLDLVKAFSKAKELLTQRQPKPTYVPYWYERMKVALSDTELPLQSGYFCVYRLRSQTGR
jgi:phage regulator Rha-like protein